MTKLALIGAGPMAMAYAAVLKDLKADTRVIGRGYKSAAAFKEKTGLDVRTGRLDDYLSSDEPLPTQARWHYLFPRPQSPLRELILWSATFQMSFLQC